MKKLIFAIAGLMLIITAGVLEQIYIQKSYATMRDEAMELREKIVKKDDSALEAARELKNNWLKNRELMEAFTPHNETKEIVLRLAELEGYILTEDDKSATATIEIIIEIFENIPHLLGFHWEHIFRKAAVGT